MENKQINENILSRNKKIALTGAFSALVVILGITNLGLIPIGPVASITILQIPVLIVLMLAGFPYALFVSIVFGVLSLIQAAIKPSGALDPLFVMPWCSVLPRILFACVSWVIWRLLKLIPKMPKMISAGITGFIGTFAHTLLVIGCIYIFEGSAIRELMEGKGYWAVIGALSFNAILEAIASTLVCVAVFVGLFISSKKQSKLSSEANM